MRLDAVGGPGLDVRRRAHLQGDAAVAHVRREPTEMSLAVGTDLDVVDDANPMAEAVGAAPLPSASQIDGSRTPRQRGS